jgi:N-acetylglutamate synthase-like GNAT family acetyltransferase
MGYGKRLIQECIEFARRLKMKTMAVQDDSDHRDYPEKNIFVKMGFQLVEENDTQMKILYL